MEEPEIILTSKSQPLNPLTHAPFSAAIITRWLF